MAAVETKCARASRKIDRHPSRAAEAASVRGIEQPTSRLLEKPLRQAAAVFVESDPPQPGDQGQIRGSQGIMMPKGFAEDGRHRLALPTALNP
jgi:hypothetical protein